MNIHARFPVVSPPDGMSSYYFIFTEDLRMPRKLFSVALICGLLFCNTSSQARFSPLQAIRNLPSIEPTIEDKNAGKSFRLPIRQLAAAALVLQQVTLPTLSLAAPLPSRIGINQSFEEVFSEDKQINNGVWTNPTAIPEERPIHYDPELEVFQKPMGMFALDAGPDGTYTFDPSKPTVLYVHGRNYDGVLEQPPTELDQWDFNKVMYKWSNGSYDPGNPPTDAEAYAHRVEVFKLKEAMIKLRRTLPDDYDKGLTCPAHSAGAGLVLAANMMLLSEGSDASCSRVELLDPFVGRSSMLPQESPIFSLGLYQYGDDTRTGKVMGDLARLTQSYYGVPVTVYRTLIAYFDQFPAPKNSADEDTPPAIERIWKGVHIVDLEADKSLFKEIIDQIGNLLDETPLSDVLATGIERHSVPIQYYFGSINKPMKVGINASTDLTGRFAAEYKQKLDIDGVGGRVGKRK